MAAIKDVAKFAGMSVAVVSKYLQNPQSVRKDTKEKIEEAIQALNYVPSPIARSLRTKRSGMIAVVVPDIINPFFAELFDVIRKTCISQSMLAILQTAQNDSEIDQTIESVLSRQIDGVILCFLDDEKFINALKEKAPDLPVTSMSWHKYADNIGNIVLDVRRGIYDVTKYLLENGCMKFGYIGGPEESIISSEKFKGFLSAIESSNNKNARLISVRRGKSSMLSGHDFIKEMHESNPYIDAIVCENDALAIGCLTYCLNQKIPVPSSMKITGFDDIPLSEIFEPSLTTVHLPIEEMGKCAAEMLSKRIIDKVAVKESIFETTLVIRKST